MIGTHFKVYDIDFRTYARKLQEKITERRIEHFIKKENENISTLRVEICQTKFISNRFHSEDFGKIFKELHMTVASQTL